MSAGDLLARIVERLERFGIPYMVVGSFASTFHGVPRTTHDLDLVIDPTRHSLAALLQSLPEADYYVSAEAAEDALQRRSMFNVIDLATGWKVDLIVRKDRPFSVEELARRTRVRLLDHDVFMATAEDTVLSKLEWGAAGESARQLRDAEGVVAVKAGALDDAYIDRWAKELSLVAAWERLRRKQ